MTEQLPSRDNVDVHSPLRSVSGTYLMVIGEVEATPGGPVIKAVKVQDLSADPVAKLMWRQEVLDLHTHAL